MILFIIYHPLMYTSYKHYYYTVSITVDMSLVSVWIMKPPTTNTIFITVVHISMNNYLLNLYILST